jgi:hypothetical protein
MKKALLVFSLALALASIPSFSQPQSAAPIGAPPPLITPTAGCTCGAVSGGGTECCWPIKDGYSCVTTYPPWTQSCGTEEQ